jgi:hypothetical protein
MENIEETPFTTAIASYPFLWIQIVLSTLTRRHELSANNPLLERRTLIFPYSSPKRGKAFQPHVGYGKENMAPYHFKPLSALIDMDFAFWLVLLKFDPPDC